LTGGSFSILFSDPKTAVEFHHERNLMMRNLLLIVSALIVSGCATSNRQPVTGLLYSDVKANENVTDNGVATKRGEACVESYLGAVATGDASLEAAKKNGGITQVSYVDNYTNGFFLVYEKYCLVVHGK
jgi:hypothetical protein